MHYVKWVHRFFEVCKAKLLSTLYTRMIVVSTSFSSFNSVCSFPLSLSLSFHSPRIKMLIRRHYLHCLSAFKRTSELKKANSRSSFLVTKRKTTDLVFDAVSPLFSWGNKTDEKKVSAFDMKATLLSCSFWCILCFAERLIYYYCYCYDISNRSAWLDGFTWLFQFIYAPRMQHTIPFSRVRRSPKFIHNFDE